MSSVKVAVRVRPFNEREQGSKVCVQMNGPTTTIFDPATGDERPFTFDYSFWSHDGFETDSNGVYKPTSAKYADQQQVYDCLGKQVLDNAWEGYNCCLFAYGQTGSGKSYSMIGYGANIGIVPIACDEIFKRCRKLTTAETQFQVNFSMLEIYNEKVQDLLVDPSRRPAGGLKVREHKQLGVYVQDLSKHPVGSYDEIDEKMEDGQRNRSIGATQMNATSSRGHTIITIELKQLITEQGRKSEKISVINLVDLAGSEKAGQTGATGDRLKEGCAINRSLTVLGQCISALADKAIGKGKNVVVPYRDAALTRILQTALGGNSKTIMICALSPAFMNYEETLSTLRYADRAKKIQNKAVINESPQDKIIRELKEENKKLKEALMKLAAAGEGGKAVNLKEMGLGNLNEIIENMDENEKIMEDLQKPWEEKLAEERAKSSSFIQAKTERPSAEELKEEKPSDAEMKADLDINANKEVKQPEEKKEQKVEPKEEEKELSLIERKAKKAARTDDKTVPHISNLHEDPQLSGIQYYSLTKCPFYIGRKTGNPKPSIILGALGIQPNHASLHLLDNGLIELRVSDPEANRNTQVNGNFIKTKNEKGQYVQTLFHNDTIALAHNNIYVFRYPLMRRKIRKVTIKLLPKGLDDQELEVQVKKTMLEEGLFAPNADKQEEELKEGETPAEVDKTVPGPNNLGVHDYTPEEIDEDSKAVDWDAAFEEVQNSQLKKKEKQNAKQQKKAEEERQKLEKEYNDKLEKERQEAQRLHDEKLKEFEEQKLKMSQEQKENEERVRALEEAKDQALKESNMLSQKEQEHEEKLKQQQEQLLLKQEELELMQKEMTRKQEEQKKAIEEKEKQFKLEEKRQQALKEKKMAVKSKLDEIQGLINEANEISRQFGQDIVFKYQLIGSYEDNSLQVNSQTVDDLLKRRKEIIQIRVEDNINDQVYIWTVEKFQDRVHMMRDLLSQQDEIGKMPEVQEDENPFYDVPEPILIGYAYYKLEGLSWLLDNPSTTSIISSTFEVFGKLNLNVIPVDPDGNEDLADEMIPDDQEDLLERRIDFIVKIDNAENLPLDFCRDVYCQYSFFLDNQKYKTGKIKGKNQNPKFNYMHHHTVNCVTSLLLEHLKNDCLTVELYGYPDMKKSGSASGVAKKKVTKNTSMNSTMEESMNTTVNNTTNNNQLNNSASYTFNVVD